MSDIQIKQEKLEIYETNQNEANYSKNFKPKKSKKSKLFRHFHSRQSLSNAFQVLKLKRLFNTTPSKIKKPLRKINYSNCADLMNDEDSNPATFIAYNADLTWAKQEKLPWETYFRKRKITEKKTVPQLFTNTSLDEANFRSKCSKNEKLMKYEKLKRQRSFDKVTKSDLVHKKNKNTVRSGGDLKEYLYNNNYNNNSVNNLSCSYSCKSSDLKNEFVVVKELNSSECTLDIVARVLKVNASNL